MRKRRVPAMLLLVIGLGACAAPGTSPVARGTEPVGRPADPAAEIRPDLIAVEPVEAAPGDVVALTFPAQTTRGILFVLEERIGDAWFQRFYLRSDGPGPEWPMSWTPVDAGLMAVEDIGVGGPGPDHVPIPEVVQPGAYRICTGNAADEICAAIVIVAP